MPSANTLTVDRAVRADLRQCHAFYQRAPDEFVAIGAHPSMGTMTLERIQRLYTGPEWSIKWAERDAGTYHPLMYRGDYDHEERTLRSPTPDEHRALTHSIEHVDILIDDLVDIARVVVPSPKNKEAYGSRIRNLLVNACTEVETQCKAVLLANGYPKKSRDLKMDDYVRLCAPLCLDIYAVGPLRFPDYPEIRPFKDWKPDHGLPWYQAYNRTKHDREKHFEDATLENAINAVAGAFIMLLAQFGWLQTHELQTRFFTLVEMPDWEADERDWLPPIGGDFSPIPYDFTKPAT